MKAIPGWENIYSLTEDGKLFSHRRNIFVKITHSIGHKNSLKIPCFHLYKNQKLTNITLHRLLALTFIPNPNNYPQVNHKDGNPLNNSLDNLEWCTQSQNIKHAYDNGLMKPQRGKRKNTNGEPNIHKTRNNKLVVQVWHKGKPYNGGTHIKMEDAIISRDNLIKKFESMN